MLGKITGVLILIMLAYRMNPLTVPSVTVRLRKKSSKTRTKPTTMIGIVKRR